MITGSSTGSPFPFEDFTNTAELEFDQASTAGGRIAYGKSPERSLWPGLLSSSSSSTPNSQLLMRNPGQLSMPSCGMPLAKALQDHSSTLVEYYFKEVCGMMSCYDSQMNPYRTTISNSWSSSVSLYYTTQSMAAACLSEVSPGFSSVGRQLRDQAVLSFPGASGDKSHVMENSYLLSLVMLGMSLCWHDPNDVGQKQFEMLAGMDLSLDNGSTTGTTLSLADRQQRYFFYNSLIYWQMLLAFVTDREYHIPSVLPTHSEPALSTGIVPDDLRTPHPQTGIGIDVQRLVGKVGTLVRKERRRIRSRRVASRRDIDQAELAIKEAEVLHSQLCEINFPQESTIVDSGDELTPASHLVNIAEAYRCTGLLQLYRNFPDLLVPYLSCSDPGNLLMAVGSMDQSQSGVGDENAVNSWLVCLALHIVDLVQQIPISSRSRSIQPLLLVSISSDLALGRGTYSAASAIIAPVASIASSHRFQIPPTDLEVLSARKSVISRLSSLQNILAAKPIRMMLQLVNETWAQMEDSQEEEVYWMDVMIDKGYETLMG